MIWHQHLFNDDLYCICIDLFNEMYSQWSLVVVIWNISGHEKFQNLYFSCSSHSMVKTRTFVIHISQYPLVLHLYLLARAIGLVEFLCSIYNTIYQPVSKFANGPIYNILFPILWVPLVMLYTDNRFFKVISIQDLGYRIKIHEFNPNSVIVKFCYMGKL